MLRYATSSADRDCLWDAFDILVLRAASEHHTFEGVTQALPAGISFSLIHRSLELAASDGLLSRAAGDSVRYQLTPAGRARLLTPACGSEVAAA